MNTLLERLQTVEKRYEELTQILMDPSIANDIQKMTQASKEQASLEKAYNLYKEYKALLDGIEEAKELLNENDPEIKEMAKMELEELEKKQPIMEHDIQIELIPKDPNDEKNVVMEIRGAAGGDEGNIFAGDLFRMYSKYAESQGWKIEIEDAQPSEAGGYSLISFIIKGNGVYSKMKFESGSHRVQRVPETESQGRIQTSTCSVAVMPEAEDVEVHIDDKDIRIDVMRASGNGGQCVNTTDSAVRLTHYPTGIVIYSQTEKSQIQNKEKAFALLRTKLYDLELQKKQDAESEERRSQIGTGDRSEKIRTYNFPQGRVTDHRINLTLYKLDKILDGDIQEIIDACIAADQAKKLAKMQDEN